MTKKTTATTPKKTAKVTGYFYSGYDDTNSAFYDNIDYDNMSDCLRGLDSDCGGELEGYYIYEVKVTRKWKVLPQKVDLEEVPL